MGFDHIISGTVTASESVNIDLLQAVVPRAVLATASLGYSLGREGLKAMVMGSNPIEM